MVTVSVKPLSGRRNMPIHPNHPINGILYCKEGRIHPCLLVHQLFLGIAISAPNKYVYWWINRYNKGGYLSWAPNILIPSYF